MMMERGSRPDPLPSVAASWKYAKNSLSTVFTPMSDATAGASAQLTPMSQAKGESSERRPARRANGSHRHHEDSHDGDKRHHLVIR